MQKLSFSCLLTFFIGLGIWGLAAQPAEAAPDPNSTCPVLSFCQNPTSWSGYACAANVPDDSITCYVGRETGTNARCIKHCYFEGSGPFG